MLDIIIIVETEEERKRERDVQTNRRQLSLEKKLRSNPSSLNTLAVKVESGALEECA